MIFFSFPTSDVRLLLLLFVIASFW